MKGKSRRRTLSFLAAVVLLAAALLAPSAEASRYLPYALAPSQAPPAPVLEVDQVDAEAFPLFTENDVRLISALAFLDASEAAQLSAEKRLRPIADSDEIARPAELAAIRKLASGVLTSESETNIWQIGGLSQNRGSPSFQGLWTDPSTGLSYARNRWYDPRTASWLSEDPKGNVDSPNLYAFVAWGPHMGTDPMGLATDFNRGAPGDPRYERSLEQSRKILEWCRDNPVECEEQYQQALAKFQGTLMVLGGCSEAIAGVGLSTGGVTTIGGLYMVGAGTDTCSTGFAMLLSGEKHLQLRERKLVEMGMDEDDAQLLVAGVDIAVSSGTGLMSRGGKLAAGQEMSTNGPSMRFNFADELRPYQKGTLGQVWSRQRAIEQGATIVGEEVELVFQIGGKPVKVRADLLLFDEADELYIYVESKFSWLAPFTKNQKKVVPALVQAGDQGMLAEIGARTGGGTLQEGMTVRVVFEGDIWQRAPNLLGDIE